MKCLNGEEHSVVNGALTLTISTFIVKLIGLIYKIPLSYILSDEGMGYFNTAYTVYTFFFVVCTAGVPKAISVIVAERSVRDGRAEAEKICGVALRAFFALGALCTILFIALAPSISSFIGSEKSRYAMLAIAPSVFFVCAAGVLRGYFSGMMELIPVAVSEMIAGVCKLVCGLALAFAAYLNRREAYMIAAYSIFGISIGAFFGFVYLYAVKVRRCPAQAHTSTVIQMKFGEVFKIAKFVLPITMTSVIGSLLNLIDVGLVMRNLSKSGFSELQANILYGNYTTLVIPMFNTLSVLLTPLSSVLLPVFARLEAEGDRRELIEKGSAVMNAAVFFSTVIGAVFLFFSPELLSAVFEDSSAAMAAPLLAMLAPSTVLMSVLTISNTVAEGQKNFVLPMLSLGIGSIIKIVVTVMLVPHDSFNIVAAPLGTLLSYAIGATISYAYISHFKRIVLPIAKPFLCAASVSACATLAAIYVKHITRNVDYGNLRPILVLTIYAIVVALYMFARFYLLKKHKSSAKSTKNKG